jgi:hypothetical protein
MINAITCCSRVDAPALINPLLCSTSGKNQS